MSGTLGYTSLRNEYPSRSFQMGCPPVSLCDARDACWHFCVLKRTLTLLVRNNVCKRHVAFRSACLHVISAWVGLAIFQPVCWFYSCPQHLVSFQHDSRDRLRLWDKRVNGSRDRCKTFWSLLIRNARVLSVLLGVLDLWNYTCIESYHSFNSGNVAPKSLDLR